MIRINLLATERAKAKAPAMMPEARRVTLGASLVLLVTVLGLGWWFWSLHQQSLLLDIDITSAEVETKQLRAVLSKVQKFEARKAQLQQRVTLIEQLRKGQTAPVRVLDQISRSVPDRLWLANLKQSGNEFTLDGYATTMTALSDFVAGIEDTNWFKKPVEIIDSQMTTDPKTGDLVKFVVKANYVDPDMPVPATPIKPGATK
ncbi:MAG: PilN domain-containing protein [Vicinamibacterales bacterium]